MPFSNTKAALTLVLLGAGLLALNLGVTFWRSTIPRSLSGTIQEIVTLTEDREGVDDVHLLRFANGTQIHVDRLVREVVNEGDVLTKPAWSRTLHRNGEPLRLGWPLDLKRFLWAAPVILSILFGLYFRVGSMCNHPPA